MLVMNSIRIHSLRSGLFIMMMILVIGTLVIRWLPGNYVVSVQESAAIADNNKGMPPYEFWKRFESEDAEYILLDIRDRESFAQGHIERALNIPFSEIAEKKSIRSLNKDTVFVYSDSEALSNMAALLLNMLGVDAKAINGDFRIIESVKDGSKNPSYLFYSERKTRFNYPVYFKAFDTPEPDQVEIEVPLPAPTGC